MLEELFLGMALGTITSKISFSRCDAMDDVVQRTAMNLKPGDFVSIMMIVVQSKRQVKFKKLGYELKQKSHEKSIVINVSSIQVKNQQCQKSPEL